MILSVFALLLFILLPTYAANVKQSTEGDCSPAINNISGQVSVVCIIISVDELSKLNSLPELAKYNDNIYQLLLLKNHVQSLQSDIREIKNSTVKDTSVDQENILALQRSVREQAHQLNILEKTQRDLGYELSRKLSEQGVFFKDDINRVSDLQRSEFADRMDRAFQRSSEKIIAEITLKLDKFEAHLNDLARRVQQLSTNVDFLMNEFLKGNLEENVSFLGISLGGLFVDKEWQPKISIQYEFLLPKMPITKSKGSVFLS